MPNATMKVKGSRSVYVADQIETASNRSGVYYTRAFEKGYMTNFVRASCVRECVTDGATVTSASNPPGRRCALLTTTASQGCPT